MTLEDLSSAAADRYADRMMHDVRATSHIRFPPRLSPPASARESLAEHEETEEVVSARVETPDAPPAAAPRPKSAQERFQEFYAAFEHVESSLHTHLTPEDRERMARALAPPRAAPDPATIVVGVSVAAVLVTALVCLQSGGRTRTHRAYAGGASDAASSNYNISRILRGVSPRR